MSLVESSLNKFKPRELIPLLFKANSESLDIKYQQFLEKMAESKGLCFKPTGLDTCPRMVIEAKMLGCKLHLNDNVQHKDEIWFNTDDQFDTEAYLYAARDRFWKGIKYAMEWRPSILVQINCWIDGQTPRVLFLHMSVTDEHR